MWMQKHTRDGTPPVVTSGCEDRKFDPIWTHTDCIMGAWHSRIREGTMNPRMRIPMLQIANIKASVERFEAEGGGESPSIRSE